jgi:dolichyl-phosphate-mannose--protein O-mannosyl transferase
MAIHREAPRKRSPWISVWFFLDAVVALAPPLYWAVNGRSELFLGLPASVWYFVIVAAFITASIIAAYLSDLAAGEIR